MYYPFHYYCETRRSRTNGYIYQPFISTAIRPTNFPPVDIHGLKQSAIKFEALMKQAQLILNKIAYSPQFAHDMMDAAQKSNQKKVDELILSTGITVISKSHFTPDGIKIELNNANDGGACCSFIIGLKW